MIRTLGPLAIAAVVAGCSGNPLGNEVNQPSSGANSRSYNGSYNDSGIQPEPDFAPQVSYDSATDTLQVDNLPFDGNGDYVRDPLVSSVAGFSVYTNTNTTERRDYQALFGDTGNVRAVIVRTGSYLSFGFGGFLYERDVRPSLPTTGSATYDGTYAGLRVYNGQSGLDYTAGNVELEIDFIDFENQRATIEGFVSDRALYDQAGNHLRDLPTLILATSYANDLAEFDSNAGSRIGTEVYEEGHYYGILGGASGEEIVGIVVVNGEDENDPDGVSFQESGVFIAVD